MSKNTALGAEKSKERKITFKNKEHEKFYHTYLSKCRYQDTYHKALVYCLGLSEDTRRNVKRIYDFETGLIKPECLQEGWQTSGSCCLTRLAFNLWNGWNADGCATPYDLFTTSDATYMLEAVRLRYPEYCKNPQVPSMSRAR